jgi:hypothetical protein
MSAKKPASTVTSSTWRTVVVTPSSYLFNRSHSLSLALEVGSRPRRPVANLGIGRWVVRSRAFLSISPGTVAGFAG